MDLNTNTAPTRLEPERLIPDYAGTRARGQAMTSDDQWHRIRFPKGDPISGTMGRFFMDSLLPAIEELGRNIDLNTVAIFGVDDSKGGRYVYLSPGAFSAFATLALTHRAQPCDPPATESASLLYGDELSARKLLTG